MTDPNDKYRPPARPPAIAVDMDGTLAEWAFPDIGEPNELVIEALRVLKAKGWHIVIHTCRVNSHWEEPDRTQIVQEMLDWLVANDVPFDNVWGLKFAMATCDTLGEDGWMSIIGRPGAPVAVWAYSTETGKPLADVYIDDRAYGFCDCHYNAVLMEPSDDWMSLAEILAYKGGYPDWHSGQIDEEEDK